jgi:hypothetical protein
VQHAKKRQIMSNITIDIDAIILNTDLSAISTLTNELLNPTDITVDVEFISHARESHSTIKLSQVHNFWESLVNRSGLQPGQKTSFTPYGYKYRIVNSIMFLIEIILLQQGDIEKISDYIADITRNSDGFRLYPIPDNN